MARPRSWLRITTTSLDPRIYGRIVHAVRHRSGALLLHRKFVSRNSHDYRRCGSWIVVVGREVIRSKTYINSKEIRIAPTRWAAGILRLHAAGVFRTEWAAHEAATCRSCGDGAEEMTPCRQCRRCALGDGAIGGDHRARSTGGAGPYDVANASGTRPLPVAEARRRYPGKQDALLWHPAGYDELPRSMAPYAKQATSWGRKWKIRRRHTRSRKAKGTLLPPDGTAASALGQ
jgi:hypothetical protein